MARKFVRDTIEKYNKLKYYDVYRYNAPIDPFKIINVDPDEIDRFTRRSIPLWKNNSNRFGSVINGDWDQKCDLVVDSEYEESRWLYELIFTEELTDSVFYQSFKEHFCNNVEWRDTEFIQRNIEMVERGREGWKKSNSEKELMNSCKYMDRLYSEILSEGYKSQNELEQDQAFLDSRLNEILVDIGRNGELLLVDNRHRLTIAKIANIESVPVVFLVRHPQWMRYRDYVYNTKSRKRHPDFDEFR